MGIIDKTPSTNNIIGISSSRLNHIIAVARKMMAEVEKHRDKYECTPEEAFILGLLHDIGYEFTSDQTEHNTVGGIVLKEQGYKYWREVYYHSTVQNEYTSSELILLTYCDLTTGPNGEDFTFQERFDNVGERYGVDSPQMQRANELKDFIQNHGIQLQ